MTDAILVLNAGSSSLKFMLFVVEGDGGLRQRLSGNAEELTGAARFRAAGPDGASLGEHVWDAPPGHAGALAYLLDWLKGEMGAARLAGVGHRVVHGGLDYAAPIRVNPTILARLRGLIPLAPLHQPHNLLPIAQMLETRPDLPQVACFDTAFHRTAPEVAQAFALPEEITARGVRRYGFHGLSYEYIASILPEVDPAAAAGRTIVLHLGNGASMCALRAGKSQATTMGFTALDGLPMGTRCGAIDPGVVIYLEQALGMSAQAVEDLLYKKSGMLGVSGVSSDMREILASDAPRAAFALELYAYRIGRELGSLAAALGGLDAVVFTAGVGENAPRIRAAAAAHAAWLGLELDPEANAAGRSSDRGSDRGARRISAAGSRVAAWVAPTNEELMIARHALRVIRGA